MKVLLISANTTVSPYPVFPLGAAIVCNTLRQAGHQVTFLDWLAAGGSTEMLRSLAETSNPDFVAISIRNIDNVDSVNEERYLENVIRIIADVRAVCPAPIVRGGAGYSLMPEAILEQTGADYGIVGEGERGILEFIRMLQSSPPPRGTVFRAGLLLDSAGIGCADYSLRELDYYVTRGGMVGVQTKRGCLHGCAYCTYPLLEGRQLRPRSAALVVDDIQRLKARSLAYLYFVDSVFNDDEGLYMDVIREMRARSISIPWTAYFRPARIPDADLAMMVETGLASAEIGSDGATEATLRGMNKPHSWQDIAEMDSALRRHEVATAHYFVFGGPGETTATLEEGISRVKGLDKSVRFIYSGLRVLPWTAIAGMYRKPDGTRPSSSELTTPCYYFSEGITREALHARLLEAFKDDPLCLYPPGKGLQNLTNLHEKGFCGPMWEMLLGKRPPRRLVKHA